MGRLAISHQITGYNVSPTSKLLKLLERPIKKIMATNRLKVVLRQPFLTVHVSLGRVFHFYLR